MAKVGSQDVALLAGVSRSTVSRVFTPGTYVADDTRVKVIRAAELLGYRPNVIARSLTTRRTRLVGVVTGHLENPSHAAVVRLIASGVQDHGMATLLVTAHYNEVERVMQSLISYQVDALVVTSAVPTSGISRECEREGIALVVTQKRPEPIAGLQVYSDNRVGVDLVTEHLVKQGWKRFGHIAGIPEVSTTIERKEAFAVALARHGHHLLASEDGGYEYDMAVGAMRRLMQRDPRPDAVFCGNDVMAAAALDVARFELGLKPGVDIGIVGYDESPLAALRGYQLTSVRQAFPEIARAAVDYIVTARGPEASPPGDIAIPPELTVRASSLRLNSPHN